MRQTLQGVAGGLIQIDAAGLVLGTWPGADSIRHAQLTLAHWMALGATKAGIHRGMIGNMRSGFFVTPVMGRRFG